MAGGKGLRMGSDLPKQFIAMGGKPVLMHTMDAFYRFDENINIVLVLPLSHHDYWKQLCREYRFRIPHQVVMGGDTRFQSVKNGLSLIKEGLVGVHDGVRPFASLHLIKRCYEAAEAQNAVIPVIPSTDSLREISADGSSHIVDRSRIQLVQTPQVFKARLLKEAYRTDFKDVFTDDASVVEATGERVYMVEGEVSNIKITTPFDLKVGEVILNIGQIFNL